jgi:hypothetical protein
MVLVIVIRLLLDHGEIHRLLLGALMFVPILLATVRLSARL